MPFIGEIRMFAGSFAPAGWAFCEGQSMPIAENDALFTLIGTRYGGDGQETFKLPDLASRVPLHFGTGPGNITYQLGEKAGTEQETLTVQQIPTHTHPWLASNAAAAANQPVGGVPAVAQGDLYTTSLSPTPMSNNAVVPAGGSQPHTNVQPILCINFIISLFGVFPPRP
jgi:microcystin-dependent protein